MYDPGNSGSSAIIMDAFDGSPSEGAARTQIAPTTTAAARIATKELSPTA